jgi:transposase
MTMADCKLTKEIAEVIYIYLENGSTYEIAAQAVGVHRNTLYNWICRGEKEEPEYQDFVQNITKARAKAEIKYLNIVEKAMEKDWTAARWKLAHMNPDAWGDKSEQKIEHSQKEPLKINFVVDNGKTDNGDKDSKVVKSNDNKDKPVSVGGGQQ